MVFLKYLEYWAEEGPLLLLEVVFAAGALEFDIEECKLVELADVGFVV